MTRLPFYLVDAFVVEDGGGSDDGGPGRMRCPTSHPPPRPSGNPAAVVLLPPDAPALNDATHAALAAEFKQAETAFVRLAEEEGGAHGLRWFTPTAEVPMCGHATLAAAAALVEAGRLDAGGVARFDTLSGRLAVARPDGGGGGRHGRPTTLTMDLPARPPTADALPACAPAVVAAVLAGSDAGSPVATAFNADLRYLAVRLLSGGAAAVRGLAPDPGALLAATGGGRGGGGDVSGVVVLATDGSDSATVATRFFGPWIGIDEDAATGSAAAVAVPWLAGGGGGGGGAGSGDFSIRQLSARGGSMAAALVDGGATVRLTAGVRVVVAGEVRL